MKKEQLSSHEGRAPIAVPALTQDFWPVDSLTAWRDDPMRTLHHWLAQLRVAGVRSFRESSTGTYTAMFSTWVAHLTERKMSVLEASAAEAFAFFEQKAMEPVSRRRYLQLLDRVYVHLYRCGRTAPNPMLYELSKERELERDPPPVLSPKQQEVLEAHLTGLPGWKGMRDRALAALLLGSGLRANEVILQEVGNVDENYLVKVRPKSVHRPHDSLILPDGPYRKWFSAWLQERQAQMIPGVLVVPATRKGLPFDPSGLFRRTKSWLDDAGISAAQSGPNLLRSTFGRNALESGRYSLQEVQEFMGHEDSRTTEKLMPSVHDPCDTLAYN